MMPHFEGNNLKCRTCHWKFKKFIHLVHHMNIVHGVRNKKINILNENIKHMPDDDVEIPQDDDISDTLQSSVEIGNIAFIEPEQSVSKLDNDNPNEQLLSTDHYHKLLQPSGTVYKCRLCPMVFPAKHSYLRHKAEHRNDATAHCGICRKIVKNSNALVSHMIVYHGDASLAPQKDAKADCPMCLESFMNKKQLLNHVESNHNMKICDICSATLDSVDKQRDHKCTMCRHCSTQCYTSTDLTAHIHKAHGLSLCDICGAPNVVKSKTGDHRIVHSEPTYKCPSCSLMFYPKHDNQLRMKLCFKEVIHGIQNNGKKHVKAAFEQMFEHAPSTLQEDEILDTSESSVDIGNIAFIKQENEFECSSSNTTDVEQEITVSSQPSQGNGDNNEIDISVTKCAHCSKECYHEGRLATHFSRKHKVFKCDICHDAIVGSDKFSNHMHSNHAGTEYTCPHCSKEFQLKQSYLRHMDTYRKVKVGVSIQEKDAKINCPICRENFTDKKKLSKHVETIHNSKICEICSMTLGSADEQNNHMCTMCTHCNKQCYTSKDLSAHIHEAHELKACEICGESFVALSEMLYHKFIAHPAPKYKCPQCSIKFHVKDTYLRHLDFCSKGKDHAFRFCRRTFRSSIDLSSLIKVLHDAAIILNSNDDKEPENYEGLDTPK